MRLHLVRHGHTIWNDTGGVAGRTDIDLSETGQQAVSDLARTWPADETPGRWYSSPLMRTRRTTQLLRERVRSLEVLSPLLLDERLVELDFGDWEGMTWSAVHEECQEEMALWGEDWVNRSPPNGETFAQQAARCSSFLEELLSDEHDERNTMVILHGGSIRAMVCECLGWPLTRAMSFNVDPATVTMLDFDREQNQWEVRKINSTSFRPD